MTLKARRFLLIFLVVAILAGAGAWVLAKRSSAKAALPVTAQTSGIELAATDVTRVRKQALIQGLPVAGTLKAVNAAVVKARAAGELQGLNVREGDTVKAGQVLGRIDSTESQARLKQAQQQADASRAQRDIAQRQFDNNQALVNQGFISRTALDTSLASLQAAEATYRAALAAADVTRKALEDTVVKAPIAGQVAQRLAQSGERVSVDARLIEIVDSSRLELEASFSPAESLLLKLGQQAVLRIEGSDQPLMAKLARINPSAQAASRSVTAYFSLQPSPQQAPTLRQGLFVQGTLGTGSTDVLAVPLTALRIDKPTPYVQLVQDGRVVHRSVTPGTRGQAASGAENSATVTEWISVQGLPESSWVINGSVGSLPEGSAVRFTTLPEDMVMPASAASSASSASSSTASPK